MHKPLYYSIQNTKITIVDEYNFKSPPVIVTFRDKSISP